MIEGRTKLILMHAGYRVFAEAGVYKAADAKDTIGYVVVTPKGDQPQRYKKPENAWKKALELYNKAKGL